MFDIDPATGRLMVKNPLDFEAARSEATPPNVYTVMVRATDSSGDHTGESDAAGVDATVTITVIDVNEAPTVTGEGMANDHAEDAAVALMTGPVVGNRVVDGHGGRP